MTAGDVMDLSAGLLNDSAKTVFTYVNMLPYLNSAIQELLEQMQLNNVESTNEVSSVFVINIGMTDIGGLTGPPLPADLIEIRGVYERQSGSIEDFQIMVRVDFLPPYVELLEALVYWCWQKQTIQFIGATTIRDVKLNYLASVIQPVTDPNTAITQFNSKLFLAYRTAQLCALYIGENETRYQSLGQETQGHLDRFLGINTKGRQSIFTRRLPFMAGYKVRTGF